MCDFVSLLLFAKRRDSIKTHSHHSTGFCTKEHCNFDVFAVVLVSAHFFVDPALVGEKIWGKKDKKQKDIEPSQTGLGF